MWLVPTDLEVTTGSIATFNCTLKCEHQDTHSMQWLVGGHSFRMRRVLLSYRSIFENRFYQRTGIRVTIEEETTCGSGQPDEIMKQTLSFKALSVEAINRTAVQCVAIRKDPSLTDFLSYYGVLLVKGETNYNYDFLSVNDIDKIITRSNFNLHKCLCLMLYKK